MKIINTFINTMSLLVYPFILAQKYPIHLDRNGLISIFLVLTITVYCNIFRPLKANKLFNVVYMILIFFILYFIKPMEYPFHLILLWLSILFICLCTNKSAPNPVIWNLLVPIFETIIITFPITHFLSPQIILTIILINLFSFSIDYLNTINQTFFGGMCLGIILFGLYLLKYLTLTTILSYMIGFIILLIFKYFKKIKFVNYRQDIIRIIFSIISTIN